MKLDDKWLKVLGVATAAAGVGISLLSGWVGDKKTDKLIEEKVQKAIQEKK